MYNCITLQHSYSDEQLEQYICDRIRLYPFNVKLNQPRNSLISFVFVSIFIEVGHLAAVLTFVPKHLALFSILLRFVKTMHFLKLFLLCCVKTKDNLRVIVLKL